jgi:hypothetical protein
VVSGGSVAMSIGYIDSSFPESRLSLGDRPQSHLVRLVQGVPEVVRPVREFSGLKHSVPSSPDLRTDGTDHFEPWIS